MTTGNPGGEIPALHPRRPAEEGDPGWVAPRVRPIADRRIHSYDWFSIAYLLVTLPLLVLFAERDPNALLLAGAHAAGIVVIVGGRKLGVTRFPILDLIYSLYPLLLFALLYTEVGLLCRIVNPGVFHDAAIQDLENTTFGGQPSQDLHRRLNSRSLGEYLHVGYFSYYMLAPVLVISLFAKRMRHELEVSLGTICLVFYTCFLIFVFYPVTGPYHQFTPPPVEDVGYRMPYVTRWLLDRGSAIGAAFPSSHVAVAVVVWMMAMRYHFILAVLYAVLVPALAVGAIYGGYHYAVDVLAGALLGLLVGTLGHRISRALSR